MHAQPGARHCSSNRRQLELRKGVRLDEQALLQAPSLTRHKLQAVVLHQPAGRCLDLQRGDACSQAHACAVAKGRREEPVVQEGCISTLGAALGDLFGQPTLRRESVWIRDEPWIVLEGHLIQEHHRACRNLEAGKSRSLWQLANSTKHSGRRVAVAFPDARLQVWQLPQGILHQITSLQYRRKLVAQTLLLVGILSQIQQEPRRDVAGRVHSSHQ
mmetsp:Transcript_77572/g.222153  ORF Transcript_77572/g.222153 Transcript_77572/m.222153 type:complete len:216 (-) Transcript_77572:926-1573(-)